LDWILFESNLSDAGFEGWKLFEKITLNSSSPNRPST
jgi:hypothetical protein